jgi:hypothetical protein
LWVFSQAIHSGAAAADRLFAVTQLQDAA